MQTEKKITLTLQPTDGSEQKEKEVGLAYCFATEIAYKDLAGHDIRDYIPAAIDDLTADPPRLPDIKATIYFILAAHMAHCQAHDTEVTIESRELMTQVSPADLGTALGTVLSLRAAFYHVPEGEPKDKPASDGDPAKNA